MNGRICLPLIGCAHGAIGDADCDYRATDRSGIGASVTFLIDRPGPTALHARLTATGQRTSSLRVAFYGRHEFDRYDPDGYHLMVGCATDDPPTPQPADGSAPA